MRSFRLTLLPSLVLLSCWACSPTSSTNGGNANNNGNSNTNANTNGDADAPADVSFPDGAGGLLAIDQDGGVSATILGDANDAGTPATVSGLRAGTGEDEFVADFDDQLRTDRIVIGDTEIAFDYSGADSFNFTVNRGEESVFSGNGLNVSRETTAHVSRVVQQAEPEDIIVCGISWVELLAIVVEQELTLDPFAVPAPEFIDCVLNVEEVQDIALMICISNLVLIPSVIDALAECQLYEDPFVCFDRAVPALEAISFFSEILNVVLLEIIFQIRLDGGLCG
jgi:hypothetical protein